MSELPAGPAADHRRPGGHPAARHPADGGRPGLHLVEAPVPRPYVDGALAELTEGERDDLLELAVRSLLDAESLAFRALEPLSSEELALVVARFSVKNATFAQTLSRLAEAKLTARRSVNGG